MVSTRTTPTPPPRTSLSRGPPCLRTLGATPAEYSWSRACLSWHTPSRSYTPAMWGPPCPSAIAPSTGLLSHEEHTSRCRAGYSCLHASEGPRFGDASVPRCHRASHVAERATYRHRAVGSHRVVGRAHGDQT